MRNLIIYLITVCLLSACYQPISESAEKGKKTDGMTCDLQVSVFSSIGTEHYPVFLMLFDSDGKCIKELSLTKDNPKAFFSLEYGQYRLSALSGTAYFKFPQENKLEAQLSYSPDLLPQQPLLMGQVSITLSSPTASASLQLDQQTAEVNISISDLPTDAKQVKFTLDSPYSCINLQGSLSEPNAISIPCQKKTNEWQAGPYYIFPTQGTNIIASLELKHEGSDLFYGYNLPFSLQANYHYQLNVSYLNGFLLENMSIEPFTTNSNWKSDSIILDRLPNAPCLWDGHIVAHIEKQSATVGSLWLLSCNEWEDVYSNNNEDYPNEALEIAQNYEEGGTLTGRLTQWVIPSREDANMLKILYAAQNSSLLNDVLSKAHLPILSLSDESGDNVRYLCNDAQHTFSLVSASSSISKAGSKATYRLRLIKKIQYRIKS